MGIEDVLIHLGYTSDEVDMVYKEKILKTIEIGKARLKSLTGTELDYAENLLAKELLLNYCRYALNNGNEYFEGNFAKVSEQAT